jgi:hypothetical protein
METSEPLHAPYASLRPAFAGRLPMGLDSIGPARTAHSLLISSGY